ncbi:hypothetical protein Sinac_1637 [Singulisphaera acidiphila DSM 18658]|uniref:Uncharacterized protein n=1 Tax=Singulisphaera acidiphila (strain ATCC BAA-1392 / DSM 18658 / VKM B-2454 / MOB10) TaxID=886293 RepID=L0DAY2_SINAD|nr:hypothetical protein Sinac_1637 [Singulisphaera acidiphila DSM 18658]
MFDTLEDRREVGEVIRAFGLSPATTAADVTRLRPFAEIVKLLPRGRGGRSRHVSVMHRWTLTGRLNQKLESVQTGGIRCTSLLWVYEFFQRLTTADQPTTQANSQPTFPLQVRTSTQREKALARAERELDKLGV